jgi:hypothetical protein
MPPALCGLVRAVAEIMGFHARVHAHARPCSRWLAERCCSAVEAAHLGHPPLLHARGVFGTLAWGSRRGCPGTSGRRQRDLVSSVMLSASSAAGLRERQAIAGGGMGKTASHRNHSPAGTACMLRTLSAARQHCEQLLLLTLSYYLGAVDFCNDCRAMIMSACLTGTRICWFSLQWAWVPCKQQIRAKAQLFCNPVLVLVTEQIGCDAKAV